jgi:hypothetical protein
MYSVSFLLTGQFSQAWDAGFGANAPAHRLDEFPAGYSSAGFSPALPASTHGGQVAISRIYLLWPEYARPGNNEPHHIGGPTTTRAF